MKEHNHREDWFYEGQVSSKLVEYFKENGYSILKDNSHNIQARGEDIIISKHEQKEIIEVKGYPSSTYTKGTKKGKLKSTNLKLQAKHWFSEALLASIFNYQRQKTKCNIKLALAFPLEDKYKELLGKVEDFFSDHNIDFRVYFVDKNGQVTIDNLNRKERNKSR